MKNKFSKFLTLFFCLVMGMNVWGEETIFQYNWSGSSTMPARNTSISATGGSILFNSTGGSNFVSAQSCSGYVTNTPDDMKLGTTSSPKALKFGNNDTYAAITLTSGKFQNGDLVFICGYSDFFVSASTSNFDGGLAKVTPAGTGSNTFGMNATGVAIQNLPNEGASTIYLSRKSGSSAYFVAIKIVHPAEDTREDLGEAFAWSAASATVTKDANDNVFPTLTNTHNVAVSYSSTSEAVATINNSGAITLVKAGTTTIKAAFAGDETYKAKTVSYTLTVNPSASASDDATLSDIKINGVSIEGFVATTTTYNYIVNADAISQPTITYTLGNENAEATVKVAGSIPGSTTIDVTAENQVAKKTYTINLKYPDFVLPVGGAKYKIANAQAITGGEVINTDVEGVSLVCGSANDVKAWKAGKTDGNIVGFDAFTEGNGDNPSISNNIPTANTFYKFTVTKSGVISAAVACNGDKNLYVKDGEGKQILKINPKTKVYKMVSFDVEAEKTYYIYAEGSKLGFYGFAFTPASYTLHVTDAGWGTLYLPFATVPAANTTLYTGTLSGTTLSLTAQTQIPANTPLLVKAVEGDYTFTAADGSAFAPIENNALYGVMVATPYTTIATTTDQTPLALGLDANNVVGFRQPKNTELPANRACLLYEGTPSAPIRIVVGEQVATDIESVNAETVAQKVMINGQVYILRGDKLYTAQGQLVK